ncbi:unnamed protein product [Thelazia callipaeda]|uniref:Pre-mRNA-splicing factor CWC25 homolog n=1 Tax=Thelazia callipaeda TaxID=103827 RepID=A0A0N5CVB9_THECL|nr:unnamed protein product [Thelazia callipaeda]
MVEQKTDDRKHLAWIYEGPKSLVNREDYLLGKKVDRHFELYSDVVTKDKESGIEAVEKPLRQFQDAASSKISNLGIDIVRTEDPLVAIKMKEEKSWQDKVGNPLIRLKMQKLMRKLMDKKGKKRLKLKELKKKEKRRQRSNNDSYLEDKQSKKAQRDSHVPLHLRPKYSSTSSTSSDNEEQVRIKSAGKRNKGDKKMSKGGSVESFSKSSLRKDKFENYKKPDRCKLTAEEMEARRQEMLANADWRDEVRAKNIRRNAQLDEDENKKNEGKAASFIRPLLNNAAATMTMAQRLSSNRKGLQRTVGLNEDKFIKR